MLHLLDILTLISSGIDVPLYTVTALCSLNNGIFSDSKLFAGHKSYKQNQDPEI